MHMRTRAVELFLSAAVVFTACESSPTSPTAASADPVVIRLEMAGPNILTPSESTRFQLIAYFNDGSSRDVTNEARWRSSPAAARVLSTSDVGLVVGLDPGEGVVEARFNVLLALKSVMVLRAGTYRLSGNVSEDGVPSESVVGAQVEITKGVGTGMTDETDEHGWFRLYGVTGEIGLRVTKDGYEPAVRTITVVDHHPVHKIELTPLARSVAVSGNYTLTITAAGECRVGLGEGHVPEEARIRTYTAAVRQDGLGLVVTLGGARFPWGAGFDGRVEPGRVTFDLRQLDSESPPPIAERLPSSRLLFLVGSAAASGSTNRLVGVFSGRFLVYETEANRPAIASCSSASHQFVLSRE